MITTLCIILTITSASLTHLSVRLACGWFRKLLFTFGIALLAIAMFFGGALGGFWPGFYTLLSLYFLTTAISPWLVYFFMRSDDS